MRRGIIEILHGGEAGVIVGGISIRQQSIKGDYRKLTANEKGDHRNIAWGGAGVIVGGISIRQQRRGIIEILQNLMERSGKFH